MSCTSPLTVASTMVARDSSQGVAIVIGAVIALFGGVAVIGIVAVINVINFIDGVDGLAAGVCVISALTLSVIALSPVGLATAFAAVTAGAAGTDLFAITLPPLPGPRPETAGATVPQ